MTLKDTIKMINEAYNSLRILNNINWKAYRDEIYKLEKQYEKNHFIKDIKYCYKFVSCTLRRNFLSLF